MARYDVYLFIHIVAAIVWLGSGLLLSVLALRATRAGDNEGLRRIAADAAALSNTLFIPASMTVLAFGLLMVVDGPWGFDQLWVVLGLAGFAVTSATGILFVKPRSEKIDAMLERDGMTDEAALEIQRLLVIGRADVVVLYLIVMDMVLKPTGGQVAVLAVMGAVLLGALAYAVLGVRALSKSASLTPAAGSPAGA
ncbi:MAG: hypothetical protein AVDCRST_MAG38-346 [uncultured Solirubrobacteraceae bacterium]|uniref:Integral membrane protein n=1 Tax=uncultured Solirubrobacteraceae bacterium TaxID=1162706 RepID=A0A6J4R382_9ACTN|nr:MAG: hypothetical protein AVDCRST_MAG38-346 [uncultured Solirubrobacteraceae bacterium]